MNLLYVLKRIFRNAYILVLIFALYLVTISYYIIDKTFIFISMASFAFIAYLTIVKPAMSIKNDMLAIYIKTESFLKRFKLLSYIFKYKNANDYFANDLRNTFRDIILLIIVLSFLFIITFILKTLLVLYNVDISDINMLRVSYYLFLSLFILTIIVSLYYKILGNQCCSTMKS